MCYCQWSFLSKIQRFFQVFLRPSANSTFTRSAFGLWCTPWHKYKHLVQTTGMRLVKSSVPVHLACDTKNWTCTVPCGCGIRWPERRDRVMRKLRKQTLESWGNRRDEGKEGLELKCGALGTSLSLLLWGTEIGCDERPILHRAWRDALGSANGSWSYSLPKYQSSAHLAWVHREDCLKLRGGSVGERGWVWSRRDKLEPGSFISYSSYWSLENRGTSPAEQ